MPGGGGGAGGVSRQPPGPVVRAPSPVKFAPETREGAAGLPRCGSGPWGLRLSDGRRGAGGVRAGPGRGRAWPGRGQGVARAGGGAAARTPELSAPRCCSSRSRLPPPFGSPVSPAPPWAAGRRGAADPRQPGQTGWSTPGYSAPLKPGKSVLRELTSPVSRLSVGNRYAGSPGTRYAGNPAPLTPAPR